MNSTPQPDPGSTEVVPDLDRRVTAGIFHNVDDAQAAARDLQNDGFRIDDLSIVYKGSGSTPNRGAEETHSDQGVLAGISGGALVGGALGLIALAIPGIGPLVAAGPIAAAISGAVAGGTLGGLIGSFVGLGIPTDQAKQYEEAVRSGGVVLTVRATDPDAAARALAILNQHNAEGVASYTPEL